MPSFIFSSSHRPPRLHWPWVWVGALAIAAAFVASMEVRLLARGFPPTAVDSELSWLRQRDRASQLGENALILVGASRMQCDINVDVLRERTNLEPVQLAIDGTSFVPILAGLAADPAVRGTVIVDFSDGHLAEPEVEDTGWRGIAWAYEVDFEQHRYSSIFNYETSEAALTDAVRGQLRSYADGARPLTSLLKRILPHSATPQYAIILSDRSRLLDFRMVTIPDLYYARAIRTLGEDVEMQAGMTFAEIDRKIRMRVDALAPHADAVYLQRAASVVAMAASIEARGGHVMFVVLPTSGLVTAINDKRFPRQQFWDRFVAKTQSRAVHFADVPALQKFPTPDGSHLDYRDRAAFTLALADALGL